MEASSGSLLHTASGITSFMLPAPLGRWVPGAPQPNSECIIISFWLLDPCMHGLLAAPQNRASRCVVPFAISSRLLISGQVQRASSSTAVVHQDIPIAVCRRFRLFSHAIGLASLICWERSYIRFLQGQSSSASILLRAPLECTAATFRSAAKQAFSALGCVLKATVGRATI